MAEFTGDTYVEYVSDVEIDFSKMTRDEIQELFKTIWNRETYTFKEVDLVYEGEVTIEVEPSELDKLDDVLPKRLRQFGIQAY